MEKTRSYRFKVPNDGESAHAMVRALNKLAAKHGVHAKHFARPTLMNGGRDAVTTHHISGPIDKVDKFHKTMAQAIKDAKS